MQLNQRIQFLLSKKGMSQAELSRASGISSAQVAHIVTGRTKDPAISFAIKIADALDVSLDYLAGRDMDEIQYSDEYRQKLNDHYEQLNDEGKKQVLSHLDYQLTQNPKSKNNSVSGVA